MSAPSSTAPGRYTHGLGARVLLVVLGLIFALVGGSVVAVITRALWESSGGPGTMVELVGLCVFLAIGIYGVLLARRGLRGWSRPGALERGSPRFERRFAELIPLFGLASGVTVWAWTGGRAAPPELLWYFIVSFAFFPIAAAVHEFGHLLPGLAQGRVLHSIRIWPVTLHRSSSGELRGAGAWRISDGLPGFVQWSDLGPEVGRSADLVMLAGGPLLNLVAAAGLWALSGEPERLPEMLVGILRAAALCNVLIGLQNLIPSARSSPVPSDGTQILRALKPGYRGFQKRQRLLRRAFLVRPRDWGVSSRELTDEPTSDPADRAWLVLLALAVALDRGDRAECDRVLALQSHLEPIPADVLQEFVLQRALIHALLDGDRIAARAALGSTPVSPPAYGELALAAVLFAEGRQAEAADSLQRWTLAAKQHLPWIAGNQWAVDALGEQLALTARPS